jgi:D-amino-acid dehydrogenase
MVSSTRAGLKAAVTEMELMAERGIRGRSLSRDEVLSEEPILKSHVLGGVLFPDEAQIEPVQTTVSIADAFKAQGGKILSGYEVFDFEVSDQGRITCVRTTQGEFRPELVVLAAGSWSPQLGKKLGLRVPVLGGKGYSMTLSGVARTPVRPIMIVERKIAVTPFDGKLRIAGTLELVNRDNSISTTRLDAIHSGAHEYLSLSDSNSPATMAQSRDIWRGLRPCTPDGVPMVGFSKKLTNLFYNTGHQMLGLQSAPGTAKLAADLIAGKSSIVDPAPFSPVRFE